MVLIYGFAPTDLASGFGGRLLVDGIVFESHFATAIAALATLAADGLLRFGTRGFELTPVGRLLTRNVAMCFDAYLPAHAREATAHFSRAV